MAVSDIRDGNPVKERLASGETVVGCFARMGSEVVEIAAFAGCDFVIVDNEHSPLGWERTAAMLLAAESAGTVPLLRVPNSSRDLITRALDSGAHGVMVPQVETADTAAAVVAATIYGPGGVRGTAGNRRTGFGLRIPLQEYVDAANRSTLVVVQVESVAAVDHAAQIAAVPGIDCVFIGLSDLSVDLDLAGQWDHPVVAEHVDNVLAACTASGVAVGVPVVTSAMGREYMKLGARFIATGDVTVFGRAMQAFVEGVKPSAA